MQERQAIADVVVVIPGILGSTLARNGSLVWAPSAGVVWDAIRSFGTSLDALTLPVDLGDGHPGDGVEPVALMPDLHVLPGLWSANIGYDRLLQWLTSRFTLDPPDPADPLRPANLLPFPYDWRLSNRFNARRLKAVVEPALERWRAMGPAIQGPAVREARLIFICHSMGGLLARWYVEQEGGAAFTRKLITIGTPHRGAAAAARQLVNGVEKGLGPLRLNLTRFARSLPSIHQLLPQYACLITPGGLEPLTAISLPGIVPPLHKDAMAFHASLDGGVAPERSPVDLHPIVGTRQPTPTTLCLVGERLESSEQIEGAAEGGDGTVPRLAAAPKALRPNHPSLRYAPDQHMALHSTPAVLDELEGVLTARPVVHRGPSGAGGGVEIGLRTEPLLVLGDPLEVWAEVAAPTPVGLMAELLEESGRVVEQRKLAVEGSAQTYRFRPGAPGAWQVRVRPAGALAGRVPPVSALTLVAPAEEEP